MPLDNEMFGVESFEAGDEAFVPAVFARSGDEADQYCQLLSDHDVPAKVGADEDPLDEDEDHRAASQRGITHGVPVLVPESLLDEASEIIADREDFAEFDDEEEDEEEEEDETFGLAEELDDEGAPAFLEDADGDALDEEDADMDGMDEEDEEYC